MRKFPEENTPEFENIKSRREAGEDGRVLARELSMTYKSFKDACVNHGIKMKTPNVIPIEPPEPEIINLPPVKLRDYKAKRVKRGDEEIAVLHAGDGHAAKVTKSFDATVYQFRMDTMFDSIMTVITLHRHMYPINKIHIFNDGDNVQGENPYQGSNIGSVEKM